MRKMYSLKQLEEIANARVESLVEGGTLSNAKPIYFHGLNIYSNSGNSFQMHILNNSSNKIDTIQKLKNWAQAISGSVLLAGHGCIEVNNTFYPIIAIIKLISNQYSLYYLSSTSGSTEISNFSWENNFDGVQDNINKIN